MHAPPHLRLSWVRGDVPAGIRTRLWLLAAELCCTFIHCLLAPHLHPNHFVRLLPAGLVVLADELWVGPA
jgi:hypothetical protein